MGFGLVPRSGRHHRSASGIPDDFKGVPIVNIDKKPVYQKLTLDAILGAEILSAVNLEPGMELQRTARGAFCPATDSARVVSALVSNT